jgi:hypothetical protein
MGIELGNNHNHTTEPTTLGLLINNSQLLHIFANTGGLELTLACFIAKDCYALGQKLKNSKLQPYGDVLSLRLDLILT